MLKERQLSTVSAAKAVIPHSAKFGSREPPAIPSRSDQTESSRFSISVLSQGSFRVP